MQFKLTAVSTKLDDGQDTEVSLTVGEVATVEDALYAYSQFLRAVGFTYIDQVGAMTDDGQEWWSSL
jgi:hypothetical protein